MVNSTKDTDFNTEALLRDLKQLQKKLDTIVFDVVAFQKVTIALKSVKKHK
jgi:hypothetical protein